MLGRNKKNGFTIIEVVLVLAVAGLIFLMVFVAFPALQRSQRDAQRRQDFATLSAQLKQAKVNGANIIPNKGTGCAKETIEELNANASNVACYILRNFTNNTSNNMNTDAGGGSGEKTKFLDPDNTPYKLRMEPKYSFNSKWNFAPSTSIDKHYIVITFNSECSNDAGSQGGAKEKVSQNAFTIRYQMENGNIYCLNEEL